MATRQHGVVSIRQLESLGFTPAAVRREVAASRLHRLHRGVYAVGHERLTWHGYCLAAVLANSPAAVASHFSAGWLWGLLLNRPSGRFHVTSPNRRHPKPEFVMHHTSLADDDQALVEMIPVTSLARTQLDLAAKVSVERVCRFLARSEADETLDLRALESVLDRCGHHPGRGTLRTALDVYTPDLTTTRSSVERRFRDLAVKAGLPPPSMNYVIGGYELDAYWPDHRLAVELDTYGTHGSRLSFEEDRKRQRELGLLGITVERVTDRQLDEEPDDILQALAARLSYSAPA